MPQGSSHLPHVFEETTLQVFKNSELHWSAVKDGTRSFIPTRLDGCSLARTEPAGPVVPPLQNAVTLRARGAGTSRCGTSASLVAGESVCGAFPQGMLHKSRHTGKHITRFQIQPKPDRRNNSHPGAAHSYSTSRLAPPCTNTCSLSPSKQSPL